MKSRLIITNRSSSSKKTNRSKHLCFILRTALIRTLCVSAYILSNIQIGFQKLDPKSGWWVVHVYWSEVVIVTVVPNNNLSRPLVLCLWRWLWVKHLTYGDYLRAPETQHALVRRHRILTLHGSKRKVLPWKITTRSWSRVPVFFMNYQNCVCSHDVPKFSLAVFILVWYLLAYLLNSHWDISEDLSSRSHSLRSV